MGRVQAAFVLTLVIVFSTPGSSQECPGNCQCTETDDGQLARCRGGMLSNIMSSLKGNVTSLVITSASNLRTLRPSDFPLGDVHLKRLSISNCWVQDIQDGTFQNLKNLVELDLSFNSIATIRQGAFSGLSSLKVLNLTHNNIANVASVLRSLFRLEKLDLSYNALSDLHTGAFRSQSHLVYLRLDGNRLENLDGYVFQGLQNLQHLSLRHCLLSSIASDMFSIVRSIQILDLGQNVIRELPSSEEFRNLPALSHLLLDSNQIIQLSESQFSGMTLDLLTLSRNQIKRVTLNTFRYFNARELDLSYNLINEIQSGFLKPTAPQLEKLNLAGNPLHLIPKLAFEGLYRLKHLNLSNCQLEKIHKSQFDNLQNLNDLDVSWNKLKNIPQEIFDSLPASSLFQFHRNFWNCDCYIAPLKTWLEAKAPDMLVCYKDPQFQDQCASEMCHSPAKFIDIRIVTLKDDDIKECTTVVESDQLPANTQIAIVVSCLLISIFFIGLAILLWKRGKTKDDLKRQCIKSPSEPVSSHMDFLEDKPKPLDNVSLSESDRNFVFRKYFQTMPSNPDIFLEATALSHNTSGLGADSLYSSMPSVNSDSSVNIGIETTV